MWTAYTAADLFLITANSTLKKSSHALVMGRGIARQARDRFPGLAEALGQHILNACGSPSASLRTGPGEYGLLISPRWPAAKLGAFQVKYHYRQPASLELIQHSTTALCDWCTEHPKAAVALNFPGIGNGRLPRTAVLSILQQLPDTVTIWEYPSFNKDTL
jgi:hypothetical protein